MTFGPELRGQAPALHHRHAVRDLDAAQVMVRSTHLEGELEALRDGKVTFIGVGSEKTMPGRETVGRNRLTGDSLLQRLEHTRQEEPKLVRPFRQEMQLRLPLSDVSWDADAFEFKMTLRFGEMGGELRVNGTINDHGEIVGRITAEDQPSSRPDLTCRTGSGCCWKRRLSGPPTCSTLVGSTGSWAARLGIAWRQEYDGFICER